MALAAVRSVPSRLSRPDGGATVVIGRIGRPFGRRGEVFVEPLNGDPARFRDMASAVVVPPGRPARRVAFRSTRIHKRRPVVRFAGARSIDDAETLRGSEVRVSASELPELPRDRFYCDELIGCRAETPDGAPLGEVTDVVDTAGPGLLVLVGPEGGEDLVPFVAALCVTVDLTRRRLVLDLPEGLLGLNRG